MYPSCHTSNYEHLISDMISTIAFLELKISELVKNTALTNDPSLHKPTPTRSTSNSNNEPLLLLTLAGHSTCHFMLTIKYNR